MCSMCLCVSKKKSEFDYVITYALLNTFLVGLFKNGLLIQIDVLRNGSIAPQVFQLIKTPCIAVKNVDNDIKIVHNNPRGLQTAFDMIRGDRLFGFHTAVNAVRDGTYLDIRIAFADDEKVGGRVVQFSEVKFDDIFTFNVLNGVNDNIVESFSSDAQFSDARFFDQNLLCVQIFYSFLLKKRKLGVLCPSFLRLK